MSDSFFPNEFMTINAENEITITSEGVERMVQFLDFLFDILKKEGFYSTKEMASEIRSTFKNAIKNKIVSRET